MALISGQVTSFNAPNYEGDIYSITPEDTPLLSAIGGMFGGEGVNTTMFGWQEYDLRDVAQTSGLEGQAAPAGTGRTRTNVTNVLQIIHEVIDVSYTKQATFKQVADIGSAHPNIVSDGQGNPIMSEFDWQMEVRLKEIARDIEHTLINGVFVEPANNSTARQTRGLLAATVTNDTDLATLAVNVTGEDADDLIDDTTTAFVDNDKVQFTVKVGGSALDINKTYYVVSKLANTFQLADSLGGTPLSFGSDITATTTIEKVADLAQADINQIMQDVWDNGGIRESETATLIANSWNKRQLTAAFLGVSTGGFRQSDRNVGGVNLQTFETEFGMLNIMLNRYEPANTVQVVSMEQLRMKWLLQDLGTFFAEPLGKDGIRDQSQLAGEWGLEYGNELAHGKLSGLSTR